MVVSFFLVRLVKFFLAIQKFLLSLVAWSYFGINNSDKYKTILVLRISALGDFIFSIPALTLLRKQFPKSKIILLTATTTKKNQKKLLKSYVNDQNYPWLSFVKPSIIDEVFIINSVDLNYLNKYLKPKIKELNPQISIILAHPGEAGLGLFKKIIFLRYLGVRGKIYGWRTKASNKWMRKTQYTAGLYDHHVISPLMSVAEIPDVQKISEDEIDFPINLSNQASQWTIALWHKYNLHDRKVIAVAPGSIQSHKRWPIEYYVELCNKLLSIPKVTIVIIGTNDDRDIGLFLSKSLEGDIINLAGESTIEQSACILKKCALLVGNDGGAIHLGTSVRCQTVSIISGIEYPNSVEPWFSRELTVRHPVPCSPCYSFTFCPEKHGKCLKELPVNAVFEKCIRALECS